MGRWIVRKLLSAVGFDPKLVASLPARHATRLGLVAVLFILSAAMVGTSLGYGIWLVEQSAWIGVGAGMAMGWFMLSLFRVVNAGSGASAVVSAKQLLKWRPPMLPLVIVGLFAGGASQPALLLIPVSDSDGLIEAYRQDLLSKQQRSGARVYRSNFERRVAEAAFAVRRIQLRWESSTVLTALMTAAYVGCMLFPLLLLRFLWVRSVWSYQFMRVGQLRRILALQGVSAAFQRERVSKGAKRRLKPDAPDRPAEEAQVLTPEQILAFAGRSAL